MTDRSGAAPGADTNLIGAGYMTLSMAGFTLNDACMKLVVETVPLFQVVFLRGVLTLVLLAVLVRVMGGFRLWVPQGDRVKVALRTVFEVLTVVAILTALSQMPLANVTAILAALPLFVTLGAWLILGHPLGWRRMAAIGLGFFGVMLIVQPGGDAFNVYSLVALVGVLMVTGRDLVTRSFSAGLPSMTIAVITAAAVTVFGGVASLMEPWTAIDQREAAAIGGASVFIIVGYVFSILVMRVGEIGFTAPFRYTSLIWALVLGLVIFGEMPNILALIGGAIVVATGLFTFWRERRIAALR